MNYWQHEDTGYCCTAENRPSLRYYQISKHAYDLHESGLIPRPADICLTCEGCGVLLTAVSRETCPDCHGSGKCR